MRSACHSEPVLAAVASTASNLDGLQGGVPSSSLERARSLSAPGACEDVDDRVTASDYDDWRVSGAASAVQRMRRCRRMYRAQVVGAVGAACMLQQARHCLQLPAAAGSLAPACRPTHASCAWGGMITCNRAGAQIA